MKNSSDQVHRKVMSVFFCVTEEDSLIFEKEKNFPFSSEELHKEAHGLSKTVLKRRNSFVYQNQDRMLAVLAGKPSTSRAI